MCCYHTQEEVDNFPGPVIFVVNLHKMTCRKLMPEAAQRWPRIFTSLGPRFDALNKNFPRSALYPVRE